MSSLKTKKPCKKTETLHDKKWFWTKTVKMQKQQNQTRGPKGP